MPVSADNLKAALGALAEGWPALAAAQAGSSSLTGGEPISAANLKSVVDALRERLPSYETVTYTITLLDYGEDSNSGVAAWKLTFLDESLNLVEKTIDQVGGTFAPVKGTLFHSKPVRHEDRYFIPDFYNCCSPTIPEENRYCMTVGEQGSFVIA